jgi:tyrosine-protein phosphatase SIW14
MRITWRRASILGLVFLLTVVPFVVYRIDWSHAKRLRTMHDGVLYRSGQLTVDGFTDAVLRYKIRTIVNAQDEWPNPDIAQSWCNSRTIKESELCRQLGVNYIHLPPGLVSRYEAGQKTPPAIDRFMEVMDDKANLPVLLHCKAGLHRTGVLCAVYRMEYGHVSPQEAFLELKAHGFGEFFCSASNDYVNQYVLKYLPRDKMQNAKVKVVPLPEPPPGEANLEP